LFVSYVLTFSDSFHDFFIPFFYQRHIWRWTIQILFVRTL
jgi:hypothetical protein